MSSDRIQRHNQVILVVDLRDFLATFSVVAGKQAQISDERESKFYAYMDFYLKGMFEMLSVVLEFLNGSPLMDKKDVTSNLLFNSTGDGAVLIIGGKMPDNVISTYIYTFYLDCLLKKFCDKLEAEFQLPKLKRRVGIALAFGDVTAVQYRYPFPSVTAGGSAFYAITSLISEKINIAARVESLNKDHINADISLDSSFVDELYRFMFPEAKLPKEIMKDFKKLNTKQERLEMLNRLNSNDIDLLINYLGHHYFKGGDTVVHIVSPVLVEMKPDLDENVVRESEEMKVFYSAVNERMEQHVYYDLLHPLQDKLLELLRELNAL